MIITRPPSSTRRIGVDLGGRRVAWSIFVDNKLVDVGHYETKPLGNRAQELHVCSEAIATVAQGADEVYVEEPMIGRGVRSSLQVAQMGGAVLQAIGATTTLNPVLVPVDSWKKLVIGKGGVNKEKVSTWLEEHHEDWFNRCVYQRPKAGTTTNQDRVDAICVGYYGVLAAPGQEH